MFHSLWSSGPLVLAPESDNLHHPRLMVCSPASTVRLTLADLLILDPFIQFYQQLIQQQRLEANIYADGDSTQQKRDTQTPANNLVPVTWSCIKSLIILSTFTLFQKCIRGKQRPRSVRRFARRKYRRQCSYNTVPVSGVGGRRISPRTGPPSSEPFLPRPSERNTDLGDFS